MAQTIKLKRSAQAGNTPTTSQLSLGEIAINTTDGKLFIKRSVGGTESIVEVGSTGSFLPLSGGTLTGSIDVTGNVTIPTGNKIAFDTDGLTYISEDVDERLRFWVANTEFMRMTNTTTDELRLLPYGGNLFAGGNLDVTGSVTADGVQSTDGNIKVTTLGSFVGFNSQRAGVPSSGGYQLGRLNFDAYSTGTTFVSGASIQSYSDGAAWTSSSTPAYLSFQTTPSGSTSLKERIKVASNGDISFYEDTGTTPKLFWNSSKESLAIGTTSLTPTDGSNIELSSSTSSRIILDSTGTGGRKYTMASGTAGSLDFYDYDASAYRLRINADGSSVFSGAVTAGGHIITNTSSRIENQRISMEADGTLDWGSSKQYGTLTWDTNKAIIVGQQSSSLEFRTNNTGVAMTMDTSQNVNIPNGKLGIGFTTAPSSVLEVMTAGTFGTQDIARFSRPTYGATVTIAREAGDGVVYSPANLTLSADHDNNSVGTNSNIKFKTDATERMRLGPDGSCRWTPDGTTHDMTLTSGGTLLVGKTSTSVTSVGIEARNIGLLAVNRDNATPVYFGRQTSYGHLIEFRKETSIVGKLGIEASGFYLDGEASHSGLKFTSAGITPRLNGAGSDNTVNLGESGVRFKDLYLSGSVNGGGTYRAGNTGTGNIILEGGQHIFRFGSGGSYAERARIDTSGNLLVGTTSTSLYNDTSGGGINLFANGGVTLAKQATSVSDPVLLLNNTGTAGQMIDLRQDGTTVGSIGANGGYIYTGSGDTNIRFHAGVDAILPANAGGASRSEAIDLGTSGAKFKDLYLSNSAYVKNVGGVSDPDTYINFGDTANTIKMFTGGQEAARIDASQNLLVGTTDTDTQNNNAGSVADNGFVYNKGSGGYLNVARYGGTVAYFNRTSSVGTIQEFRADGVAKGNISVSSLGMGFGGGTRSSDFFLKTDGTASFASGVNLGVGVSPATILHVDNNASAPSVLRIENSEGYGEIGTNSNLFEYAATQHLFYAKDKTSEYARITSGNEFLIGCTSAGDYGITLDGSPASNSTPSMELVRDFSGTATMIRFTNISGSPYVGSITSTTSATAYNTSSDERLKDNIKDADDSGSKVDAIQVRQFDWKADGEHQDYGMVAQELLEVAPDAVTQGDTPDEMMGVDYSKLVPMLIKEIQSLRQRVAQLEE